MPEAVSKSFDAPEDVIEFPKLVARTVELGDLTVGHIVSEPGWRWSIHVRPKVGGEWCQARHGEIGRASCRERVCLVV